MSTPITSAWAVLRAQAEAEIEGLTLLWPAENNTIPSPPAALAYFELVVEPLGFIEIGGGRGANRHRTRAMLVIYVLNPRGRGMPLLLTLAESAAAAFRSFRGGGVSCEGATVQPAAGEESLTPPGVRVPAGMYDAAIVTVPLYFDQTA